MDQEPGAAAPESVAPESGLRKPNYLSPSSLGAWREDRDQYVLKYLVSGVPKIAQTQPMAVGSSFDAYVKDALNRAIFGKESIFTALFESQVESQNRDLVLKHGAHCFKAYLDGGHFDALCRLLQRSSNVCILFEKKDNGVLLNNEVVLLGYPDLSFTHNDTFCSLDWKVNGFMSRLGASPKMGHLKHKDAVLAWHGDIEYNFDKYLERVEPSWATQLSTYAWLSGVPVGAPFMAMIDQLACKPDKITVAKHRCFVSESYQKSEYQEYCKLWATVQDGHIFRELSREESDAKLDMLRGQARVFSTQSDKHEWLRKALRG